MKVCGKCNQNLDESCFVKKKYASGKYGLSWQCKECNKRYQKEHYSNNKKYYLQKSKARDIKIRKWFYETILSNSKCVDCGIDGPPEILDFDHIEDNKFKSISQLVTESYGKESILKELKKCVCRCANCHRIKTAKDFGWYDF